MPEHYGPHPAIAYDQERLFIKINKLMNAPNVTPWGAYTLGVVSLMAMTHKVPIPDAILESCMTVITKEELDRITEQILLSL